MMYPNLPERQLSGMFCTTFVLVVLLVFPLFCAFSMGLTISMLHPLGICALVYASSRLAMLTRRGERRLTALCSWSFTYLWMGVQPLLSGATGRFPLGIQLDDDTLTYTWIIVLIGMLAFDVTYAIYARIQGGRRHDMLRPPVWINARPLYMLSGVGIVLSLLALYTLGGWRYLFLIRSSPTMRAWDVLAGVDSSLVAILISLLRGIPTALVLVMLYVVTHLRSLRVAGGSRRQLRVCCMVALFSWMLTNNPLSTPRLQWASMVLASLFVVFRWRGVRSCAVWTCLLTLGVFFSFSTVNVRYTLGKAEHEGRRLGPAEFAEQVAAIVAGSIDRASTGEMDAFAELGMATEYVALHGPALGRQFLLLLTFWVPRSFWPEKPVASSHLIASFGPHPQPNVSAPLWMEGYMDFGVLGTVLFLALWGVAASATDSLLARPEHVRMGQILDIVGPLIAANAFILLRGGLVTGVIRNGIVILMVFIIYRLVFRAGAPLGHRHQSQVAAPPVP